MGFKLLWITCELKKEKNKTALSLENDKDQKNEKIISNNWREMGRILRPIHSIAQALGQDVTT